jgi:hypothetical protein
MMSQDSRYKKQIISPSNNQRAHQNKYKGQYAHKQDIVAEKVPPSLE